MKNQLESFSEFMKTRENAAKAYVTGNASPVSDIATRTSSATFFGPGGAWVTGPEEVNSQYLSDAAQFVSGETHFEIFQMDASDELAYWTGLQRATVRISGKPTPVEFSLRVTEVFRLEEEDWRMVHRHADPLEHAS